MTGPNEPQLYPNEEVYVRLQNHEITMEDHDNKKKIKKGNILLTTHRVIYYVSQDGIEVPLFHVKNIEKLGGLLQTAGVKLHLSSKGQVPPYMLDYYKKILKRSDAPAPL